MKRRLALATLAGAAAGYVACWWLEHPHVCVRCGRVASHPGPFCRHDEEDICPDCEGGGGGEWPALDPDPLDGVPLGPEPDPEDWIEAGLVTVPDDYSLSYRVLESDDWLEPAVQRETVAP